MSSAVPMASSGSSPAEHSRARSLLGKIALHVPGCVIAVTSVAAATGIAALLWPRGHPGISPVFLAAVMVSAWFGGFGAGVLATVLSALVATYLLMPPTYSFAISEDSLLRLSVFVIVAILTAALHAAIRKARDAAEAASEAKSRFLAMVTHELRNPLNPVMMTLEAMERDRDLTEKLRSDVQVIRRGVELEVRLIDDLLDLVRSSHGRLTLQMQSVDVYGPLTAALQSCSEDARARHLDILQQLTASERRVMGDAGRLQQIFWNLLRNAIKFTAPGGRISVIASNPCPGQISIEISDTGKGIEQEQLARIFDAFEQGGPDVARQFGGLGLGLAICKALIEAHGGTIGVSSQGPGHGSTFIVRLPAAATPSGEAAAEAHRTAPGPGRPLRILLVEDHEDAARLLAQLLRTYGHTVTTAASVCAAMRTLQEESFDVLVSDIGLPDGSGLELMRRTRQVRPIRGIAISGYGTEREIARSREAGFDLHLTKPIAVEQLEQALQGIMREPLNRGIGASSGLSSNKRGVWAV